ncbi:DNA binding protein [Aureococcus anophagefferens]|nr:DNA binding protein [Aureococcus anophagefferens]
MGVKILVSGPAQSKIGPVAALFCVGDFFGERVDEAAVNALPDAPIPTYFITGGDVVDNDLADRLAAKNGDGWSLEPYRCGAGGFARLARLHALPRRGLAKSLRAFDVAPFVAAHFDLDTAAAAATPRFTLSSGGGGEPYAVFAARKVAGHRPPPGLLKRKPMAAAARGEGRDAPARRRALTATRAAGRGGVRVLPTGKSRGAKLKTETKILPAFAFDKSTNWGQPDGQVRNWPGPNVEALTAGCDWDYAPYAQKLKHASIGWYPTTSQWQNFDGHDLLPAPPPLVTPAPRGLKTDGEHDKTDQLAGHCEIDVGDGSRADAAQVGGLHREEYLGHRDADRCGHQFTVLMEQHGDYACRESEAARTATSSSSRTARQGRRRALALNGELNDVRPRGPRSCAEARGGPEPAPRLICRGSTDYEEVAFDGVDYPFDRRAPRDTRRLLKKIA